MIEPACRAATEVDFLIGFAGLTALIAVVFTFGVVIGRHSLLRDR
jgi:hypothetical protein